ncbi:hypothetical protein OIE61_19270 [Streptomyces sp. NBC_01762]|uniref:hypothetical protein n=1 Tax=Streptomyces sp. NBC_01762 TaxID=2975933 RepID=UPI002DDB258A|nr:hypothetical protein [Streptomyces sp. NBC_01762]WSC45924.1 hypothetical protein OIE61_19270 [Streptomyces sp. NBC_01762]
MTEQTATPTAPTEEPAVPEQELPPTGAVPAAAAEPVPATDAPVTDVPVTDVPATQPVPAAEPPAAPEQALAVAESVPAPKSSRRVLRAVARWTAAVLVLGGLGTGTALGITSMERTDVPGLATEGDGRWDYPELSLPALPAGSPRPFNEANVAEVHHADVRKLLLPAPAGATADKKLTGGWVSTSQYLSVYQKSKRAELGQVLKDSALRHITARGWTMPDGTSSRIYLLQFNSTAFAEAFRDEISDNTSIGAQLIGAPRTDLDDTWSSGGRVENTATYAYAEDKPYGSEQVRHGYVLSGDTLALVIQSRKGKAGTERIPFHQTLILQNQLLG